MIILNMTQHKPTLQQEFEGVRTKQHESIKLALTFNALPTKEVIDEKVTELVRIADSVRYQQAQAMGQHTFEGLEECGCSYDECREAAHQTFIRELDRPLKVMIGGAPYLMGPLETALKKDGFIPLYAYSERVGVETNNPDGTVSKRFEFKHLGFYEA